MKIEIDNSRYAHNVAFVLYLFHVELLVHNGDIANGKKGFARSQNILKKNVQNLSLHFID